MAGYSHNGQINNEEQYVGEVAKILRANGYCAEANGDEVLVKVSNEKSEHFDIATSDGRVWQQLAARCRPAFF